MINLKYVQSFNTEKITKAAEKGNKKSIRNIGAFMRSAARQKIKFRKKKKPSIPGNAPFTHEGRVLKNAIRFTSDKDRTLIGPASNWIGDIGAVHEFGETRRLRLTPKQFNRTVKVGQGGPVSARKYSGKTIAGVEYTDPLDGSPVVWIKIRTVRQMEHSNRLLKRLAKSYAKTMTVKYPERPFMGPTLRENIGIVPSVLRASIKG